MTKIYQLYNWEYLKIQYKKCKMKFIKNNSNYKIIIKLYSSIISYYDENEILLINKKIDCYANLKGQANFVFSVLQKNHYNVMIKCKHFVSSPYIIKISEFDKNQKEFLHKIYMNYLEQKLLNNLISQYKSNKIAILLQNSIIS